MLKNKVKTAIIKQRLASRGDEILVAVSGGPDSVCLLYLLCSLRKELGLGLSVAHFDHMLRKGSSSDRDFVAALCARLRLPFYSGSAEVKNLCSGSSIEEAARKARMAFLIRTAKRCKAKSIALGHNLDDQAETVLMRILRGTGLYGLSAILPKRDISGFLFIRPLLGIQRKEISSYLKNRKIPIRIDRTNLQDIYLRNRLRNRLIPLLEKQFNHKIKEALSALAETSALDYEFLHQAASSHMRKMGRRIKIAAFVKLHPAMQKMLLRSYICRLQGDTRRLTNTHIKEIEDLIFNRPDNSVVHLPKGVSVCKKLKTLQFSLQR